ncbi:MAG: hypothetical protein NTV29_00195 [Planctomycetota bacterium]|nr:hypothetical protein [Planctomycetota bacterium]
MKLSAIDQGRLLYSIFMVLAFGAFLLVRRCLPRESSPLSQLGLRERFVLASAAFAGGVICAKIPFVVASIGQSSGLLAWAADGKTVTAGLAGAYLCVEIAKRFLGIRFKTGDSFALPLAVAPWNRDRFAMGNRLPRARSDASNPDLRSPLSRFDSFSSLALYPLETASDPSIAVLSNFVLHLPVHYRDDKT